MYLKERASGHLVEVLNFDELFSLYDNEVTGRSHYGEEAQDPEKFSKSDLVFLSDEPLPRCWTDPEYRQ